MGYRLTDAYRNLQFLNFKPVLIFYENNVVGGVVNCMGLINGVGNDPTLLFWGHTMMSGFKNYKRFICENKLLYVFYCCIR